MSNFENDRLVEYDRNYNAAMRKMKADNEWKEKETMKWEANPSEGKPSLEYVIGDPPLSQQEMEDRADKIAKEQIRQHDALERQGLIEPEREQQAERNSIKDFFGNDKGGAEKARADQEREKQKQLEQEKQQQKDKGRDSKP